MKKIIIQVEEKDLFKRLICRGQPKMQRRSVYKHLESDKHELSTVKGVDDSQILVQKIDECYKQLQEVW